MAASNVQAAAAEYAFRRDAALRQAEFVRAGLEPFSYHSRPMSRQAVLNARNLLWQQIQWANAAYRNFLAAEAR